MVSPTTLAVHRSDGCGRATDMAVGLREDDLVVIAMRWASALALPLKFQGHACEERAIRDRQNGDSISLSDHEGPSSPNRSAS